MIILIWWIVNVQEEPKGNDLKPEVFFNSNMNRMLKIKEV